jgi:hypothetical protein
MKEFELLKLNSYDTEKLISLRSDINKELSERRKLTPQKPLGWIKIQGVIKDNFSGYEVSVGKETFYHVGLSQLHNKVKWNNSNKPQKGDTVILEYKERRKEKDIFWSKRKAKIIEVIK